ncbi:MAG: gliding motility-associated C-terminal domain-containing protein, partial [Bacteroidota bacterium]
MKLRLGIFCLLLLLLDDAQVMATHIRAGDLIAERISETTLTYRFTVTIYTDDEGVEPDSEILFDFGTGEADQAFFPRVSSESVGNQTTKNVYIATFTFPGPGEYPVGVIIRNRNAGINNVPGSVNVPFYIESTFLITPFLGLNSSPILLIPPIDQAARGKIFIHNPGAYDPDGDSLAYVF